MDFLQKLTNLNPNKDISESKIGKSKTFNDQNSQRPEIKKSQTLSIGLNKDGKSVNTNIKNLLSHILDDQVDEAQRLTNPQTIRVKNNILLILLIASAYGVYYLIGNFLDVLLVAYIAGIAYHQSKQSFISFVTNSETYNGASQPFLRRVLKAVLWLLIGFTFPRIRYLLAHPHKIQSFPTFWDYIYSIQKNQGYIVIACEIFIGIYIIYLLIGPYLKKIGQKVRPTNIRCVQLLFAFLSILVIVGLVVIIPTVLFQEVTSVGALIEKKVQKNLGCQLIYHKQQQNSTEVSGLPLCTDKFTSENDFLRETIKQFRQQNKTLQDCMIFLQKIQETYLSDFLSKHPSWEKNVYYYEEVVCTWYSFIEKAISYSGITLNTGADDLHKVVLSTGTNIFKLFFGNLTWILSTLSNSVFNLTTFITTFLLTIRYYANDSAIKEIFSENKQELITSITNLIQATFFIVIEHFILSVMLLEIFGITPFNLIISTMLASMALFPFIRPWFGVLVVTGIRMLIYEQYYVSAMFIVLYYVLSEKIYSIHYRKMELHEIVTNMSVLFGIYQFGVAGIIYGPLIIITYQCVQRELFKKYPSPQAV